MGRGSDSGSGVELAAAELWRSVRRGCQRHRTVPGIMSVCWVPRRQPHALACESSIGAAAWAARRLSARRMVVGIHHHDVIALPVLEAADRLIAFRQRLPVQDSSSPRPSDRCGKRPCPRSGTDRES